MHDAGDAVLPCPPLRSEGTLTPILPSKGTVVLRNVLALIPSLPWMNEGCSDDDVTSDYKGATDELDGKSYNKRRIRSSRPISSLSLAIAIDRADISR